MSERDRFEARVAELEVGVQEAGDESQGRIWTFSCPLERHAAPAEDTSP